MVTACALISASFFAFNVLPNYQVLSGVAIFSFVARIFIPLRKMEESRKWYLLDHVFEFIFTICIFYVMALILQKCITWFDEKVLGIEPIMSNNFMAGSMVFATVARFFQLRKQGEM